MSGFANALLGNSKPQPKNLSHSRAIAWEAPPCFALEAYEQPEPSSGFNPEPGGAPERFRLGRLSVCRIFFEPLGSRRRVTGPAAALLRVSPSTPAGATSRRGVAGPPGLRRRDLDALFRGAGVRRAGGVDFLLDRLGRDDPRPTERARQEEFWSLALRASQQALHSPRRNPFLQTPREKNTGLSGVVHFYYPRSEQATPQPPAWADIRRASKTWIKDAGPTERVWFFRTEKP